MTRAAVHILVDAMDAADTAGTPAPCKTQPELWSNDHLTQDTELALIAHCRRCPVLQECDAYRRDARDRKLPLNGVIAGVHITFGVDTKRRRIGNTGDPMLDAARGYKVGRIALTTAVKALTNGDTHAQIAVLADVTEATVADAFRRLRDRTQVLAGEAA